MTAPNKTYLGPSKTIAMRASPGVILQVFTGKVSRAELDGALHMLDLPVVGARYVQLCRFEPNGVKDMPDDDFRTLAAKSIRDRNDRIAAFAYLIIGEGFLASMARAVVTGINVLSRPKHAVKVFSEPLEAAVWLAAQMPEGTVLPNQITTGLDELVALTRAAK
jgi:hypothetical protein